MSCLLLYTLLFWKISLAKIAKFLQIIAGNRRTFATEILQDNTKTKY